METSVSDFLLENEIRKSTQTILPFKELSYLIIVRARTKLLFIPCFSLIFPITSWASYITKPVRIGLFKILLLFYLIIFPVTIPGWRCFGSFWRIKIPNLQAYSLPCDIRTCTSFSINFFLDFTRVWCWDLNLRFTLLLSTSGVFLMMTVSSWLILYGILNACTESLPMLNSGSGLA